MDAESLLTALVRLQLMASAAILVVLLLRPLALRWSGAGTAYWLWLVVPLAAMAVLLPAREQVVMKPTVPDIPILQQHIEPGLDVGVTRGHAATAPAVQPVIPGDRSRSALLIALWLLGAGAFLTRSVVNTRRLASSPSIGPALVGVLRPRLVLPQDFETRFNAEERALILAHEEMHRVSRHTLVNALVEVARCFSWFNPLAHLAAERARADQELACDTAVIAAHPQARHAYAEALLKAQVAGVHLPMGCVWTSGTAGRLAERIARLSEQLPGRRRRFAGAACIVGLGVAASYAAWAQQPARIITVQQPNQEGAAMVATETPALEEPEAVRASATRVPGIGRPSTSQAPLLIPAVQTPQGVLPTTHDADLSRRMDVVTGGASDPIGAMLQNPAEQLKAMKERLKDPEFQQGLRAQVRMTAKRDYRGVPQELGLSEDEAERLFDLLADNQVARAVEGSVFGGPMDQQELLEAHRAQREFDRRDEESVQALLGDKYAQWQTYQKNHVPRSLVAATGGMVTAMSTQLAQAGKPPLTAAQNSALSTALIAEEQRQAQDRRILPVNPADETQMMEEHGRRFLDAIAAQVDADQFAVLRNYWSKP